MYIWDAIIPINQRSIGGQKNWFFKESYNEAWRKGQFQCRVFMNVSIPTALKAWGSFKEIHNRLAVGMSGHKVLQQRCYVKFSLISIRPLNRSPRCLFIKGGRFNMLWRPMTDFLSHYSPQISNLQHQRRTSVWHSGDPFGLVGVQQWLEKVRQHHIDTWTHPHLCRLRSVGLESYQSLQRLALAGICVRKALPVGLVSEHMAKNIATILYEACDWILVHDSTSSKI